MPITALQLCGVRNVEAGRNYVINNDSGGGKQAARDSVIDNNGDGGNQAGVDGITVLVRCGQDNRLSNNHRKSANEHRYYWGTILIWSIKVGHYRSRRLDDSEAVTICQRVTKTTCGACSADYKVVVVDK